MREESSWRSSLHCNGIKQTGPPAGFEEGAFQEVSDGNRRFCGLLLNGGKGGVRCDTMGIAQNAKLLQPVLGVTVAAFRLVTLIDVIHLFPDLDLLMDGSRSEDELDVGGGQAVDIRPAEVDGDFDSVGRAAGLCPPASG
jgi:hypothetical protein